MTTKQRIKNGLILIGLLCIVAAILLTMSNYDESMRAFEASMEVLDAIHDIQEQSGTTVPVMPDTVIELYAEKIPEMPTIDIDGNAYIGTISIPALNIELPVMETWSESKLQIAPCRYTGSYFTNDLVICAHNYAHHFSPIKTMDLGVDVWFITADNVAYHYIVENIETVQPTHIEYLTKGDWDMTLFTCNVGGQTRCAVRCFRVDDTINKTT